MVEMVMVAGEGDGKEVVVVLVLEAVFSGFCWLAKFRKDMANIQDDGHSVFQRNWFCSTWGKLGFYC